MNAIKTMRLNAGYKQFKIAQKLGISIRHYARIENNERKPKKEELNKLTNIFNCSISDLQDKGEI